MTAKILFYVQSLWGIGHLSRASAIASACCDAGFDVTLVNGGPPVPGIVEPRVRLVQLPPIRAKDETYSTLVTLSGVEIDDAFRDHRRKQLLRTLSTTPDVVITETWPFGRRKLAFELIPFISQARNAKPRPLILSSVRDILVPPKITARAREAIERTKAEFDAVLVHGDEGAIKLEESFPLAAEIREQLHYTGYVVRKPDATGDDEDRFDILVSAGGGRSGAALLAASVTAARTLDPELLWLLISGPQTGPTASADSPSNVTIISHRPDLARLMAKARLSVSQAGYNTAIEALSAGCRPMLVPFLREAETEQVQRAERFAARGWATMVRPDDLEGLASVIRNELAQEPKQRTLELRTDGAAETSRLIRTLIDRRT